MSCPAEDTLEVMQTFQQTTAALKTAATKFNEMVQQELRRDNEEAAKRTEEEMLLLQQNDDMEVL